MTFVDPEMSSIPVHNQQIPLRELREKARTLTPVYVTTLGLKLSSSELLKAVENHLINPSAPGPGQPTHLDEDALPVVDAGHPDLCKLRFECATCQTVVITGAEVHCLGDPGSGKPECVWTKGLPANAVLGCMATNPKRGLNLQHTHCPGCVQKFGMKAFSLGSYYQNQAPTTDGRTEAPCCKYTFRRTTKSGGIHELLKVPSDVKPIIRSLAQQRSPLPQPTSSPAANVFGPATTTQASPSSENVQKQRNSQRPSQVSTPRSEEVSVAPPDRTIPPAPVSKTTTRSGGSQRSRGEIVEWASLKGWLQQVDTRRRCTFTTTDVAYALLSPCVGDEVEYTFDHNTKRAKNITYVARKNSPRVLNQMIDDVQTFRVQLESAETEPTAHHACIARLSVALREVDTLFQVESPRDADAASTIAQELALLLIAVSRGNGLKSMQHVILDQACASRFLSHSGVMSQWLHSEGLTDHSANLLQLIATKVPDAIPRLLPMVMALAATPANRPKLCPLLIECLCQLTATVPGAHLAQQWHAMPLIPLGHEIAEDPRCLLRDLPSVRTKGPYESTEEYFDTYFRLLRMDCIGEITTLIRACSMGGQSSWSSNNRNYMYDCVRLRAVQVLDSSEGVFGLVLDVHPASPVRDWKFSSRLRYGNLVAIAPRGDFTAGIIWGVVADRDPVALKKFGTTYIELASVTQRSYERDLDSILELIGCGSSVMVESPTYYQAYQPVLQSLQNKTQPPFESEIIFPQPPLSVGHSPKSRGSLTRPTAAVQADIRDLSGFTVDMSPLTKSSSRGVHVSDCIRILKKANMGYSVGLSLDTSQCDALRSILVNPLSVIQGPPGTGKTFLGLKAVQLLLSMQSLDQTRAFTGPILLITQKNHALDEFLGRCMDFVDKDKIVRVGGRSDSEKLEACNLAKVRATIRFTDGKHLSTLRTELEVAQLQLADALSAALDSQVDLTTMVLRQANDSQLRHLILDCGWGKLPRKVRDRFKQEKLKKCLERHDDLAELLKSEPTDRNDSEDLLLIEAAVREAARHWLPADQVFDSLVPTAQFKPLQSADTNTSTAQAAGKATAESDGAQEDEPEVDDAVESERQSAAAAKKKWSDKCQVPLPEASSSMYDRIHIDTVCPLGSQQHLAAHQSLWALDDVQRACLYLIWRKRDRRQQSESCKAIAKQVQSLSSRIADMHTLRDVKVLEQARIVGMTLTGASIRHSLLCLLQPAVVVVEEAAEVLEPQLMACLGPWVQRLIMVGDHQQLRPMVNNYNLAKDHHLDVSLFERLIRNSHPHVTLQKQNRMLGQFVPLLHNIYPNLQSGDLVRSNQPPNCVRHPLFFWDHNDPESTEGLSVVNIPEARRVVALGLYFVEQGYRPSEVTLLAAYQGQRRVMRELVAKHLPDVWGSAQEKETIDVQTIDRYQGDENKVVIVSTVRSNREGKIGFLDTINRYCVAVSRAQCCLILVGSAATLAKHSAHWQYCLQHCLHPQQLVGSELLLTCPRHQGSHVGVTNVPEKSVTISRPCKKLCGHYFACGHECQLPCHNHGKHLKCSQSVPWVCRVNSEHKTRCPCSADKDFECPFPCGKLLSCRHPCSQTCSAPCAQSCQICEREREELRKSLAEQVERNFKEAMQTSNSWTLFPRYWALQKKDNYLSAPAKSVLHEVTHDKKLKQRIQSLIDGSCNRQLLGKGQDQKEKGDYNGLKVVKIERIENPDLWLKYRMGYNGLLKQAKLFPEYECPLRKDPVRLEYDTSMRQQLDDTINELYLFHGTSDRKIAQAITEHGFEERVARLEGLYGAGVYFAENSSKSDQYAKCEGGREFLMFVARVAMGPDVFLAGSHQKATRILPEINTDLHPGVRYSGLLGVAGHHREFVVYKGEQAYPEYLITYHRENS